MAWVQGVRSWSIWRYACAHGIGVSIAREVNECQEGPFDRALYKQKNLVERLINRLKQFRLWTAGRRSEAPTLGTYGNSGNLPMAAICKHALLLTQDSLSIRWGDFCDTIYMNHQYLFDR